jgi:glycosyltransferase involved in cell wall biosynthesis
MGKRVAVVLKGYPRLSETFIAQELLGLERAGLDLVLYAMRRPTDGKRHPIHDEIRAPVHYLPEYLYQEPLRVFSGLSKARRLPGFGHARATWLDDLKRDPSPNRVRRFGQAAVLASELADRVTWLYAHFIHTPSAVTRYASLMTGLHWSCSAHAKDIWTSPDWELAANLRSAAWAVTCTSAGHDRLTTLAHRPADVHRVYHGLDLERFAPSERLPSRRDGRSSEEPVRVLAVGRAVEKKGFDTLLAALARLPSSLAWHLTHIGGGELRSSLRARTEALSLTAKVTWRGAADQPAVLAAYRDADIFVLPSRVADNGDRDGLPNVLMEAQSQRLACISTTVSGIPELISDGQTGLLVPPGDVDALAAALSRLIADPIERRRLAEAGERRVRDRFDSRRELRALTALLTASVGGAGHAPALDGREQ